ncbi:PREDICTED: uncharacterized protein LOC107172047, partial [Diuraphis noxia]|uniref:uncharacterized protein LOC107172047 n=1 Tax=Diuraphis noxia TaxID=143948 RepID=UPI0007637BD9
LLYSIGVKSYGRFTTDQIDYYGKACNASEGKNRFVVDIVIFDYLRSRMHFLYLWICLEFIILFTALLVSKEVVATCNYSYTVMACLNKQLDLDKLT